METFKSFKGHVYVIHMYFIAAFNSPLILFIRFMSYPSVLSYVFPFLVCCIAYVCPLAFRYASVLFGQNTNGLPTEFLFSSVRRPFEISDKVLWNVVSSHLITLF